MSTSFADYDPLVHFKSEAWFVVNDFLLTFGFPTTTVLTIIETPVDAAPDEEDKNRYRSNCK